MPESPGNVPGRRVSAVAGLPIWRNGDSGDASGSILHVSGAKGAVVAQLLYCSHPTPRSEIDMREHPPLLSVKDLLAGRARGKSAILVATGEDGGSS